MFHVKRRRRKVLDAVMVELAWLRQVATGDQAERIGRDMNEITGEIARIDACDVCPSPYEEMKP